MKVASSSLAKNTFKIVLVAQVVRVVDCGSTGQEFESPLAPLESRSDVGLLHQFAKLDTIMVQRFNSFILRNEYSS